MQKVLNALYSEYAGNVSHTVRCSCILHTWCELVLMWSNTWCSICIDAPAVCVQKASVATERVSATLNAGQSVVLTVGLTAVLAMAAAGGTGAGVTAGDLVRSSLWHSPHLNPPFACAVCSSSECTCHMLYPLCPSRCPAIVG